MTLRGEHPLDHAMATTEGSALVLGAGALGASAALTLASGGVTRLSLAADRPVEPADLGMSALFAEDDLGKPRAAAAAARLRALFPAAEVTHLDAPIGPGKMLGIVRGASVAVAALDDPGAQLLAGDAALRAGVPLVVVGVLRTTAQVLTVRPGGWGGCLRCLFEEPPPAGVIPSAREAGALGPAAVLAGALAGTEALRVLTAEHGAYEGRLVSYEARSARARVVAVPRRPDCPACGGMQSLGAGPPAGRPEAT